MVTRLEAGEKPASTGNPPITITNSLDEAMERTKATLEAEVQAMQQKK